MKVSVLIPCYNFGEYIEQCILSAVSQKTNFEFEILVGDDCSTDNSLINIRRVAYYNPNVRVFTYPKNIGGYENLDVLLSNSNGDYIAYLDGDDYFTDPYKLQKQVDFMDNNPEYVMTFTGYWRREIGGGYAPDSIPGWLGLTNFKNLEVTSEDLLESNWVTFGKMFRNIFKGKTKWYENIFLGDWMMCFELSKHGKTKYLDYPTGVYREHSSGIFSILDSTKKQKIYLECKEKIKINYDGYIKSIEKFSKIE